MLWSCGAETSDSQSENPCACSSESRLAAATTRDLGAIADHLRSRTASESLLRWSAAESWHITLQFLGSTTPQQYECVTARLRELHQPPFVVELGAVDTFDRAGVLFVDVRVTPQLVALQQAVIAATIPCGFMPESRPYHPHITLARSRGKSGGRELRSLKLQIGQQSNIPSFTAEFLSSLRKHINPGRLALRTPGMLSSRWPSAG